MAKAIRANQEFFDLLAGDIFARLYTHFPEPIDIYPNGIWYNEEFEESELFDDDADRIMKLYAHTVQWLSDEGFLRFGQARVPAFQREARTPDRPAQSDKPTRQEHA